MVALMVMALVLAVAVLRDWRLWPALAAWVPMLLLALVLPSGERPDMAGDSLLIWLFAAAFALVIGVRDYACARLLRTFHKAR